MSSFGVFSDECSTFLDMMNDIDIDKKQQHYIIKKKINIISPLDQHISSFCCRNRNWDSPDLKQFWFFLFLIFSFFFFLIFWIIQSQAHCKMKRANLAPKMAQTGVTNKSARKKLLPFVTQYHPALPSLKRIHMRKWHLIQNQQRLREIFQEPPLISYRKGKSLKDLLVRAKLWRSYYLQYDVVQGSRDARRLFLTI